MKRFAMITALVAFLIGGFAFNANAQDTKPAKSTKADVKKEVVKKKTAKDDASADSKKDNAVKKDNLDQKIKEYEQTVDLCLKLYKEIQKGDKAAEKSSADFTKNLNKALEQKANLEKAKDLMNRTQVDLFNKANEKLATVMTKQ